MVAVTIGRQGKNLNRENVQMRKAVGARFLTILLSTLLAVPTLAGEQDVFKWKDEKGQWKFSNTPPPPEHSQQESIGPLPSYTGDCTPFTIGEARQLQSPARSLSHPHLQVVGLQIKMIDIGHQHSRFSWRLQIRNSSSQQENISGSIKLLDCSGFLLGEYRIDKPIAPGPTIEMYGDARAWGTMANNVGRFSVEIAGSSLTSPRPQSQQLHSTTSPSSAGRGMDFGLVRLVWSRLEGVVGDSYVAGEVINSGPGTANNVTVKVTVTSRQGTVATTGTAEVTPSTLPPGARGLFRQRVTILAIEGHAATAVPEWWPRPGMTGYGYHPGYHR